MRTLVLILMIALLPLRTWAAEGMTVRMAHEQVLAANGAATEAMPEDCPMTAQAHADPAGDADSDPTAGVHCASCHLCAAAAAAPEVARTAGPAPERAPGRTTSRYLSADPAPDLRPPIS
jgi:hypothetical protein